jgi:hypothetical protein
MALVTDPAPPPTPGERRLDRPPSDRYRDADGEGAGAAVVADGASVGRGVVFGVLAGLAGTVATVVLGGPIGLSAGLVVVAVATGWAVGTALRAGAGTTLHGRTRPAVAVAIVVIAVALGQVGLWLYARTEGGVLGLPDYLAETWGVLVPIQALVAGAAAWWAAR